MKNILITGVNFQNQGAYMMLFAAATEIRARRLGDPVIDVRWGSSRQKRREGLQTLVSVDEFGPFKSGLLDRAPSSFRDRLPFLTSSDVDGVLDASGFAFGDQWAHARLDARANRLHKFALGGAPVVVLPQAFGPFDRVRGSAETVLQSSTLLYARDQESFSYLSDLRGFSEDRVRLSCDFTVALPPRKPRDLPVDYKPGVVIVPNINIATRGKRSEYLQTLVAVAGEAARSEHNVVGLVHDTGRDLDVLLELKAQVPTVQIVKGLDGLESKWVLSAADAVVSGRFHATVSALSQGVATVVHGWSHKYRYLAEDFSVPELQSSPYSVVETIEKLKYALGDLDVTARLAREKEVLVGRISSMWDEVAVALESDG